MRFVRLPLCGLLAACLAGCLLASPTGRPLHSVASAASAKPTGDGSPVVAGTVAPTTSPSVAPPLGTGFGRVVGLDGRAAAGIQVRAFVADELVASDGGSIIANHGGGLRLLSTAQATATTGPDGSFQLPVDPQGRALNLEAVQADDVKAIALRVGTAASGLTLQLAHTGSLSGRVSAGQAGTVSDLSGIDVYVPGTSYIAKTDAAGSYTIANMPAGTFSLVASKPGLGQGNATGVVVASGREAPVPAIALHVDAPVIADVKPAAAGPGATITVTGDHFGASSGATFQVAFPGGVADAPERVDDHTIRFTLPPSAQTGDVTVSVAGLQSNARPLTVLKELHLPPDLAALQLGEHRELHVFGRDTGGALVPVSAMVDLAASGTVAIDGTRAVGRASGTGEVAARSGSLAVSAPVTVYSDAVLLHTVVGGQYARDKSGRVVMVDGLGEEARFEEPKSLLVGADGTIYVGDEDRIRAVTPDGVTTTLAGGGPKGAGDGDGAAVSFGFVSLLRLDANGHLIVLDTSTGAIREVTPAGHVTTISGTFDDATRTRLQDAAARAADAAGNLYFCENARADIWKLAPDGRSTKLATVPELAATPSHPVGMAVDAQGRLFVTDGLAAKVWRIDPAGMVEVYAGNGTRKVVDGQGTAAGFAEPAALVASPSGNLYVFETAGFSDSGSWDLVRRITPDGAVTTLGTGVPAYRDGPFGTAGFSELLSPAFMPNGDLAVIDYNLDHAIVKRITGLP